MTGKPSSFWLNDELQVLADRLMAAAGWDEPKWSRVIDAGLRALIAQYEGAPAASSQWSPAALEAVVRAAAKAGAAEALAEAGAPAPAPSGGGGDRLRAARERSAHTIPFQAPAGSPS